MKKLIFLIIFVLLFPAVIATELNWKHVNSSGVGSKCENPKIPGYLVSDYAILQSMAGITTATLCGSKSTKAVIESNSFVADGDVVINMFIPSLSGGSVYLGVDNNFKRVGPPKINGKCDSNPATSKMIEYKLSGWGDKKPHKISIKLDSTDSSCTQMVSFMNKVEFKKSAVTKSVLKNDSKPNIKPKDEVRGSNPECAIINKAENKEASGGTCWWYRASKYCTAGTIMNKLPKEKVVIHRSRLGIDCFAKGGEVLMPGDRIFVVDGKTEVKIWFQAEGYKDLQPDDLKYYKIDPGKNRVYTIPEPNNSMGNQIGTFFQYLWRLPVYMIKGIPDCFLSKRKPSFYDQTPIAVTGVLG